jgi:hypothetical protein
VPRDERPSVLVPVEVRHVPEHELVPATRLEDKRLENIDGEDPELGSPNPVIIGGGSPSISIAPIQRDVHDEVAVEILQREAFPIIRGPTTLDLNAA